MCTVHVNVKFAHHEAPVYGDISIVTAKSHSTDDSSTENVEASVGLCVLSSVTHRYYSVLQRWVNSRRL